MKTLYKYISGIESAKIINACDRYDIRGKRNLQFHKKEYIADPAFRTYFTTESPVDYSTLLETIVYNELISRGYDVKTGKTPDHEVDFVVNNGQTICYVQVTYVMQSQKTINREFSALLDIHDNYRKIIISMDPLDMSRDGIENIHMIDFLLGKKDIF